MKIRPGGEKLFRPCVRSDGQTDMTKRVFALRNFSNAPDCGIFRDSVFVILEFAAFLIKDIIKVFCTFDSDKHLSRLCFCYAVCLETTLLFHV